MFHRIRIPPSEAEAGYVDKADHEDDECNNDSGRGYVCTRQIEHRGLHVAHGVTGVMLAKWDDDRGTDDDSWRDPDDDSRRVVHRAAAGSTSEWRLIRYEDRTTDEFF